MILINKSSSLDDLPNRSLELEKSVALIYEFMNEKETDLLVPPISILNKSEQLAIYTFKDGEEIPSYTQRLETFAKEQMIEVQELLKNLGRRSPSWLEAHWPLNTNYWTTPLFTLDVATAGLLLADAHGIKGVSAAVPALPIAFETAKELGWLLSRLLGYSSRKEYKHRLIELDDFLYAMPEKKVFINRPSETKSLYERVEQNKKALQRVDYTEVNKQLVNIYRNYLN